MQEAERIVKVGIVGLGTGKKHHIPGYKSHPNAKIVAIADQNDELLQKIGQAENIPGRYHHLEDMLANEKLDIVSICLPNFLHRSSVKFALEHGCNVLCEKPMAMNTAEAEDMLQCARRTGKRLMINFSSRTNPHAHAMKELVDNGSIGDIYFVRSIWLRRRRLPGFGGWFGDRHFSGGGPIIDLGVHRLDLALYLMGFPEVDYVMASTYNYLGNEMAQAANKKFNVEDFGVALIRFKNGATLELEASWAANIKEREHISTRVLGKKGGMLYHNIGDSYDANLEYFTEIDGAHFDSQIHNPVNGAHSNMYNFVEAILHNTPHSPTAEQGVAVMRILDAIYESATKNMPVKL
ncbi:MAG: Gfo/Idh/MocA family oxidoreductase [Lentisphaeria bacterium]|nr:Gfo/Idh/MocA family oxidoreductase [Lentisphaeria bacterium]